VPQRPGRQLELDDSLAEGASVSLPLKNEKGLARVSIKTGNKTGCLALLKALAISYFGLLQNGEKEVDPLFLKLMV